MRVVVNGAGIAGTALAYWLDKLGHEVLLVEQAPRLRTGGYLLDLWGIGFDVAAKMEVLPRLRELQYRADELRMVDRRGRTRGGYPTEVLLRLTRGRFAALARADIAAAIYGLLDGRVETIFGDSVVVVEDSGARVRVGFEHAPQREVDLVVGADGLHSRVRQIVFGPESEFAYPLGCHVAAFEVEGYRPRDERLSVIHGAPGRYVSRFPVRDDKMLFFMVFRDEYLAGNIPVNDTQRRSALKDAFADLGWECPRILAALDGVANVFFDSVSQIRMNAWTRGRTALVGDAAACPSLIAGEGAGLALAEAYVLAGEIHASQGDLNTAFARYEERLKLFLARKQKFAERLVPSFVPKSAFGVGVRNFATRLMRLPVFPRLLMGRYLHDDIELPDYPI